MAQTAAAVDTNSSSHGQVEQGASQDSGHSQSNTCAEKGGLSSQRARANEETTKAGWDDISQQTFDRTQCPDVSPARCGGEGFEQCSVEATRAQRRRDREWKHFVRAEGRRKRKASAWLERQTKETVEESGGFKNERRCIQLFGNLCNWPAGPGELRKATGWIHDLCGEDGIEDKDRCSDGWGIGEILQPQVCGGRGQLCGGLCSGITARSSSGVWPIWPPEDSTSMALHQRLEEALPHTGATGVPLSSVGSRIVEDGDTGPCSESHFQFGAALHLPSTRQSFEAPQDGLSQADWRDHSFLVSGDKFDRDIGCVEDQQQGRQCFVGFGMDPIHASSTRSYLQREADGASVEVHVQRVRLCLSRLLFGSEDHTGAISSSSFRAINRSCQKPEEPRGGWVSRTSVARYEKSGRLASTWKKLDLQTQMCCLSAERYLPEIMLGHPYPHIPLPEHAHG